MIKTANLTANAEICVAGLGGTHCRINNNTAGTLYASANGGIVPGGDDVTAIPAGRGDYVVGTQGTVYLLSSSGGSVQVEGTDVLNRPFDNAAVTGGVAVGNPVVMDGLQGGVPFNSVSVSGKNLIPSDYMAKSGTYNGVTVTVKNDGRFDVNGTPTKSFTILSFAPSNYFLKGGKKYTFNCNHGYDVNTFNIFVRVYNKNGVQIQGISTYPTTITANDGDYFSWVLWAVENYEISATDVEVQLELGSTPTAYEPPITGRELTLNINGTEIAVTPDSNPYSVPDDIRQQDGLNILTVSAGELTVSYSKTDPALSRIYKTIDSLATAIVAMGAEN